MGGAAIGHCEGERRARGGADRQHIVSIGADGVVDAVVLGGAQPVPVDEELELVLAGRQVERHGPGVRAGGLHGVKEDPLCPGADNHNLPGIAQVHLIVAKGDGRGDEDAALQSRQHPLLQKVERLLHQVLVAAYFAVLAADEQCLLAS